MLLPTVVLFSCLASVIHAVGDNIGYSGDLQEGSEGGLAGTVVIQDARTVIIQGYQLSDAKAPALYWWGSPDENLRSGFRVSSKEVKKTAAGEDFQVDLDVGRTSAEFRTFGLWCERFGVNYGQAVLEPGIPNANSNGPGNATVTTRPKAVAKPAMDDGGPFQPILEDQASTARVYLFCVLGLLLLESLLRFPAFAMAVIKKGIFPPAVAIPNFPSALS
jgi:hypothetical protein